MQITFYGAAGGVTGSKHLLETDSARILMDCGTFQGQMDVRERNRAFPFEPDSIDAIVLSHAHIDHCGMLPLLVKRGFTGPIYATPATKDVADLMMQDMAEIEVSDSKFRKKKRVDAPEAREPLFTPEDIPQVVKQFKTVPFQRVQEGWTEIAPGVKLKLYEAGHILGSSMMVLDVNGERVMYSGDVGPKGMPLLYDPQIPEDEIGTVLLESTYGSRRHDDADVALERLAETVNKVCDRKGKMVIPAFSLGRTQMLVYYLHKLTDDKRIPRFPIYVDSPLATDLSEIYTKHKDSYDEETWDDFTPFNTSGDPAAHRPLAFRNLEYTRSRDDSMALNDLDGPFAIISASGMITAGRVVHHLRHTIRDPNNAIFVTGYQARGTTGRKILDGVPHVDLYGDRFPVKAEIVLLNEFSAHADAVELQEMVEAMKGVKKIVLVHGEPKQADDFKVQLQQAHSEWEVIRPEEGATIQV